MQIPVCANDITLNTRNLFLKQKTGGKKKGFRDNVKFECEEKERLWLPLCAADSSRHSICCGPLPTHPSSGGCVYSRSVKKSMYLQLSHLSSQPGATAQTDLCQHWTRVSRWAGKAVVRSLIPLQCLCRGGGNQCLPWQRMWVQGDLVLLETSPPDFMCKQSWGLKEDFCGRTFLAD